jgi:hypothetical protein
LRLGLSLTAPSLLTSLLLLAVGVVAVGLIPLMFAREVVVAQAGIES